jgi:transposase
MTLDERAEAMKRDEIVALLAAHEELAGANQELAGANQELAGENQELRRQLEWFKRQLFGEKSERRLVGSDERQMYLGEAGDEDAPPDDASVSVAEHQRRRRPRSEEPDDGDLRFDESVPVEEIRVENPALEPGEGEVVTEKVSCKLAQRPATFVVLRYIRQVVKKQDGQLSCPPAPASVLGKSVADVSLLACMAIDKFRYHLPLYRQHQRMQAAGVRLARSTLTSWIHRTADLLDPIYHSQLASILKSEVLAMDETPIKAGRRERGKMQTGYFWPVFGDKNEVAFPFSVSRAAGMVRDVLGEYCGVLISDGYRAYEKHAAEVNGLVHAQCWSHARRYFVKAESAEPRLVGRALDLIGKLYEHEAKLRGKSDEKRLEKRGQFCKPIVDELFSWLQAELAERVLLPSNPFTEAANYTLDREQALRVFLEYPNVPIDTNHLEREIRPIALGRKNWLFCWTEVGAQAVGIFQSLLSTCRLQGVDPYTYLVDVLQRVETHPASQVALLTPRLWKEHFAENPLRSDLDAVKNADS